MKRHHTERRRAGQRARLGLGECAHGAHGQVAVRQRSCSHLGCEETPVTSVAHVPVRRRSKRVPVQRLSGRRLRSAQDATEINPGPKTHLLRRQSRLISAYLGCTSANTADLG